MSWSSIKQSIIQDLNSRGLKEPGIRLRALDKIEQILLTSLPEYIQNPDKLQNINKEEFKIIIGKFKGKNLNSAESSIINEIYYRITPPAQFVICPKCGQNLNIPVSIKKEKILVCLSCGQNFTNPYIQHSNEITQPSQPTNLRKAIWVFVLIAFVIFGISQCDGSKDDIISDKEKQEYENLRQRMVVVPLRNWELSTPHTFEEYYNKEQELIREFHDALDKFDNHFSYD